MEVLLRQQAFKPKVDVHGVKLTGEAGKSSLGYIQTCMTPNSLSRMNCQYRSVDFPALTFRVSPSLLWTNASQDDLCEGHQEHLGKGGAGDGC